MKNHYIPQFLLGAWAYISTDGKIQTFRLDLKEFPTSRHTPKFTGFEDDLYALSKPFVAGMEKHAVEKNCLSQIDHQASIIHHKLVGEGLASLNIKELWGWVYFLMSLRLRQPQMIQKLTEEASTALKESLSTEPAEYETLAQEGDPQTLEEWTEKSFPGLVENFGLSFFHELVGNPKIANKIMKMKWWICDFTGLKNELLIADDPCIFTKGIDDPNLIIALPISPTKAFLATQSKEIAALIPRQDPNNLVIRLNESSLNQARIRIYARNKSPERFIHNRLRKWSLKK